MADNARPPYRADHVGSLLRPKEVLQARDEFAKGGISAEQLAQVEDAAIRDAIRMQGEVGLKSATDGEMRRQSWHMDFIYQLGGIQKVQDETIKVAFHNKDKNFEWAPPSAHVTAPVTLPRTIFADAFTFVRDNVSAGQTAKLTIPSPSMVHYRGGRDAISTEVYPDLAQFWDDLAAAYAKELTGLHDLGCRYLQLDDTSLAYVNDPVQREHVKSIGGDPLHQHETYIATINKALAGRPADMTITTHMCRSTWTASSASGTTSAPAGSSRSATCPRASMSCSGSSRARTARSSRRTSSSGASTRRPSTPTSTSSACPRSAASPPRARATTLPSSSSGTSSASSSRSRRRSGATKKVKVKTSRSQNGCVLRQSGGALRTLFS
jgi:methionine synthase II (cobalamin-independent)